MLTTNDIFFSYSGGFSNSDATQSLGGARSTVALTRKLFATITPDQESTGLTDYRCFYISNVSTSQTLSSANLWLPVKSDPSSSLSIGLYFSDDVQEISIPNVNSGTIQLIFQSHTMNLTYDPDPSVMASRIQNALTSFVDVSLTCQGIGYADHMDVVVRFKGNRYQEKIVIGTGITASVTKALDGGPINFVPSLNAQVTDVPVNVGFSQPTKSIPIVIGDFLPGDFIAVWGKRVTQQGAESLPERCVVRISGSTSS